MGSQVSKMMTEPPRDLDFKNIKPEKVLVKASPPIAAWFSGPVSCQIIPSITLKLNAENLITTGEKDVLDRDKNIYDILAFFTGRGRPDEQIQILLNILVNEQGRQGLRQLIEEVIEELSGRIVAVDNGTNNNDTALEEPFVTYSRSANEINDVDGINISTIVNAETQLLRDERSTLKGHDKKHKYHTLTWRLLTVISILVSMLVLILFILYFAIPQSEFSSSPNTPAPGASNSTKGPSPASNSRSSSSNNSNTAIIPAVAVDSVFKIPEGGFRKESENLEFLRFLDPLCNKSDIFLRIDFDKPFKTSNLDGFSCREKVIGLEISGSLNDKNFVKLLRTFNNIQYLTLAGTKICEILEELLEKVKMSNSLLLMETVLLSNLTYLEFSNLYECSGAFTFFDRFVKADNLQTIVLNNIFVSPVNEDSLNNILKNSTQLKNLKFVGNLSSHSQFFQNDLLLPKLENLYFEVISSHDKPHTARAIEEGFAAAKNLKYVYSNVVLPYENNEYVNWAQYLHNVKVLNVTIRLNRSVSKFYTFDAEMFSAFPNLLETHINITVSNNCTSLRGDKMLVRIINSRRYIGKSSPIVNLTLSSNCNFDTSKGWVWDCSRSPIELRSDRDPITSVLIHTYYLNRCPKCLYGRCSKVKYL